MYGAEGNILLSALKCTSNQLLSIIKIVHSSVHLLERKNILSEMVLCRITCASSSSQSLMLKTWDGLWLGFIFDLQAAAFKRLVFFTVWWSLYVIRLPKFMSNKNSNKAFFQFCPYYLIKLVCCLRALGFSDAFNITFFCHNMYICGFFVWVLSKVSVHSINIVWLSRMSVLIYVEDEWQVCTSTCPQVCFSPWGWCTISSLSVWIFVFVSLFLWQDCRVEAWAPEAH